MKDGSLGVAEATHLATVLYCCISSVMFAIITRLRVITSAHRLLVNLEAEMKS